eukprot:2644923-Amphidinium_carterae.1
MDRRAGLELQVILDTLKMYQGCCRWVPHHENIADSLTKMNGHATTLLRTLHSAEVKIVDEVRELQLRKEYRQSTGSNVPRPKGHQGWQDDGNTRFHKQGVIQ